MPDITEKIADKLICSLHQVVVLSNHILPDEDHRFGQKFVINVLNRSDLFLKRFLTWF